MERLIKQAFLHVETIGPHVHEGHYDLIGPNGEIILPQVWERIIEPDWSISMHMWPMPEKQPGPPHGPLPTHEFDPRRPGSRHPHARTQQPPSPGWPPGAPPPGPGAGPPDGPLGGPPIII